MVDFHKSIKRDRDELASLMDHSGEKTRTMKVKGWAVVMKDNYFLQDLTHPTIGSFYHICSKKGSADMFVNKCNKELKEKMWFVVPCEITYTV